MNGKLNGTLYVHCKESSIKSVVEKIKELHPGALGGEIMRGFRAHGAEVIMKVKVADQKELMSLGRDVYTSVSGVKSIQPTIEVSQSITG